MSGFPIGPAGEAVRRAAEVLREKLGGRTPGTAVVTGSGLGALSRRVENPVRIPLEALPGMPAAQVAGHAGELVAGDLAGVPVIVQNGRIHLYEGYPADLVALPVRVFAALGVRTLVVTNAAGALNPGWRLPALMVIADQINLMWRNPLIGPVLPGEERFPDMAGAYDPALRRLTRAVALAGGIRLEEGTYVGVLGPSYETPAEIRMLQRLGGDAVGMSTVPEVLAARARGLRVVGISVLTNPAAGLGAGPLSHRDVLAASAQVSDDLERLVVGLIRSLA